MSNQTQLKALQPNVGFVLKEATGYAVELPIDLTAVTLPGEFDLSWLKGTLKLTRMAQGLWVDGKLRAEIEADCARCLQPFGLALRIKLQELYYFPPNNAPTPIDYIIPDSAVLDLVPAIREQFDLSIPIRPLCRPDCRGLCSHCGHDLNLGDCDCEQDDIDPRLAGLQQLKELLEKE